MRLHDFHPPIAASGLFWTIRIPEDACTIDAATGSARVEVKNIFIVDQPEFPNRVPTTPGMLLDMRVAWQGTGQRERFEDAQKLFTVDAMRSRAQIEFSVSIPSIAFTWKSDPMATSSADFAIVGRERNGRYYPVRVPELRGMKEATALALLGNLSITKVTTRYQGHEAEGNAYKHDLDAAIVTATVPAAGAQVDAGAPFLLHVR
ncbi:MAG: hypothetical protein NVSMB5_02560 [Candidatus Velthaea sp.]